MSAGVLTGTMCRLGKKRIQNRHCAGAGLRFGALGDGVWKESRHLESRPKAAAREDLEMSAGWASPSSRGLWGGDALLLSTGAAADIQR
jgi:hypothetical protein